MDIGDSESCAHVRQTSLGCQRRLRRRLPRANQHVNKHGTPPLFGQRARQHVALIVAALAQTLGRERNRDKRRRSVGWNERSMYCTAGEASTNALLEPTHCAGIVDGSAAKLDQSGDGTADPMQLMRATPPGRPVVDKGTLNKDASVILRNWPMPARITFPLPSCQLTPRRGLRATVLGA